MTSTTNVKQVKLNIMTQTQYDSATKNPNELYMLTDAKVDFNDLANKPVVDQTYDPTSSNAQSGSAIAGAGFITGITSTDVTNALGYTPYDDTNPDGFISSASLADLTDTTITSPTNGQFISYNSTSGKWENTSVSTSTSWGNISGNLSDQTDLQNALNKKQNSLTAGTDLEIVEEEVVDLPEGFTQLRYVKTGLNAFVDTLISPSSFTSEPKIITKYQTEDTGDKDYFGTATNTWPTIIWDIAPSNAYIRWGTSSYISLSFLPGFSINSLSFYDVPKILEVSGLQNVSIKINNVEAATSSNPSAEMVSTEHIYVGRGRGGSTTPSGVMWYFYKIYDGDTPKFLGYAASRDSDGAIGFYDFVSETFFTSAGTEGLISGGNLVSDMVINFVNRSGYVLKTNYATTGSAGVVRAGSGLLTGSGGLVYANSLTYSQYGSALDNYFISKGTLENFVAGRGYITSASLATLTDVDITSPSQGQTLIYDATNNVWINSSPTATVGWGGITGNIDDQTDLKNALDSKASVTIRDWSL